MKGGLHQSSLPPVEITFTREQSFAQESLGQLQAAALDEISIVGDEYIPDVIGLIHQVDILRTQPEVGEVSVILRRTEQETERVAAEVKQAPDYRLSLRP